MPSRFAKCRRRAALRAGGPRFPVVALASAMALAATDGSAQVLPPQQLPPGAEPQRLDQRFERERRPVTPPLLLEPEKRRGPATPPGGARFRLNRVDIEGTGPAAPVDLDLAWRDKLGTQVGLDDLSAIAEAVTQRYRAAGFLLARAIVPAQEVADGAVRLRVVEGRIADVRVEGDYSGPRYYMADRIAAIKASQPLASGALERHLLLLNDLPGTTARAVVSPSSAPGASDLVLTMSSKPVAAEASFDNRGTRFVGPYQGRIGATFNSVLGLGEQLDLRAAIAGDRSGFFRTDRKDLVHLAGGTRVPLGSAGTWLTVDGSFSRSRPRRLPVPVDLSIVGRGTSASVAVTQSIVRSRDVNLSLRGGFGMRDTSTDQFNDGVRDFEDRTRSVSVGMTFDAVDAWQGVNLIDVTLTQGLDVLDSTRSGRDKLSRAAGRSTFTKATVEAHRLQQIHGPFSALVGVKAQYAFSQLLAAEEFGAGGPAWGRAYDPSEIAGDHGVAAKLELQYNAGTLGGIFDRAQAYAFADVGQTWRIARGTREEKPLASVGLGLRFTLLSTLEADLQGALPASRAVQAKSPGWGPRAFFSVTLRY